MSFQWELYSYVNDLVSFKSDGSLTDALRAPGKGVALIEVLQSSQENYTSAEICTKLL